MFLVIIPLLRAARCLHQSIGSLLLQPGDFDLHVHVQCADLSGDAQKLIDRWQRWLEAEPASRRKLTIRTENDAGLYDGIARGFEAVSPPDDCIMTWLGADDVILPNALATVQSILAQHPEIDWLSGQCFVSGADGANCSPHPWNDYRRANLANGKHDNRSAPFVMQEGTFWTVDLWRKAGGVDRKLRLAGDWDLWRRFANFSPLYIVDFPLGKFSQTRGRLSDDLSAYYREVDAILPTLAPVECDDFKTYKVWRYIGQTEWTITVTEWAITVVPNVKEETRPPSFLGRVRAAFTYLCHGLNKTPL